MGAVLFSGTFFQHGDTYLVALKYHLYQFYMENKLLNAAQREKLSNYSEEYLNPYVNLPFLDDMGRPIKYTKPEMAALERFEVEANNDQEETHVDVVANKEFRKELWSAILDALEDKKKPARKQLKDKLLAAVSRVMVTHDEIQSLENRIRDMNALQIKTIDDIYWNQGRIDDEQKQKN